MKKLFTLILSFEIIFCLNLVFASSVYEVKEGERLLIRWEIRESQITRYYFIPSTNEVDPAEAMNTCETNSIATGDSSSSAKWAQQEDVQYLLAANVGRCEEENCNVYNLYTIDISAEQYSYQTNPLVGLQNSLGIADPYYLFCVLSGESMTYFRPRSENSSQQRPGYFGGAPCIPICYQEVREEEHQTVASQ